MDNKSKGNFFQKWIFFFLKFFKKLQSVFIYKISAHKYLFKNLKFYKNILKFLIIDRFYQYIFSWLKLRWRPLYFMSTIFPQNL